MKNSVLPRQFLVPQDAKPGIWSQPFSVRLGDAHFLLTPDELCVKDIRIGGELLIEAIYVAVRDPHWDTGAIVLRQATVQTRGNREVVVRWNAHVVLPNQNEESEDYDWNIVLLLGENGLKFDANGLALQSFLRNRIGICVLLPDSLAGCECKSATDPLIENDSPSIVLPVDIAPHQPLRNIRNLLVETPRNDLTLSFAGEVFEMEDQRNWTDASFKIYGTPLDLPWPVPVNENDEVEQSVSANWVSRQRRNERSSLQDSLPDDNSVFHVTWQEVAHPLPSIGIRLDSDSVPSEMLDLQPRFVQIELSAEQWKNERQAAIDGLDCKLRDAKRAWDGRVEIVLAVRQALLLAGDDWLCLKSLVTSMTSPCIFGRVVALVEDIPNDCLEDVHREWISTTRQALDDCSLCVATTRYFAEINRAQSHLAELQLPAVGYGINPQVHVFGDSEIFDTLTVQSQTAVQAKRLAHEVHWWSVSLSPLNHKSEDPRLDSDLGAAWWMGSYIAALRAEVSSATWFSLGGDRGIQANSPLHRIMAQISRITAHPTPPTTVAIYAGAGIFGLRIDETEWLVNCTGKNQMGWVPKDGMASNPRQVWLEPWQILAIRTHEGIL